MTTITRLLPGLVVGEPDVAGPLAVFPLHAPQGRLEYISHAEGASRGVVVTELPQASVNNLLVTNPLDLPVLFYEGEELLGAQQNRTIDAAVLVPAGEKTSVPVSCVEQFRWDGDRHAEPMKRSPQAAAPTLRALKAGAMRARLSGGLEARADQGEVWQAVGGGPMADAFDAARPRIGELAEAIGRRDGQTGALVAVGGRFTVLDHVSRPDVFAALHAPLAQGYALDALSASGDAPAKEDAQAWIESLGAAAVSFGPTAGLGRRVHFATSRTGGTGLEHAGELLQLSVYAEEAQAGPRTRIHRPSRRR